MGRTWKKEGGNCISSSGFMRPPARRPPQTGWLVAVFTLFSTFSCAPSCFLRSFLPPALSLLLVLGLLVHSLCPLPRPPPPPPPWRRFASPSCPPHTQLWPNHAARIIRAMRACRPNIEWSLSTFNAETKKKKKKKKRRSGGEKKREEEGIWDGKLSKKTLLRGDCRSLAHAMSMYVHRYLRSNIEIQFN